MNIYRVTFTIVARNEPTVRRTLEAIGSTTAMLATVEKIAKESDPPKGPR